MKQAIPQFAIKDLLKEPAPDYGHFEGENRVFIIFDPVAPEMVKLKKGDKFVYEGRIYQIKIKLTEQMDYSKIIRFNCLKLNKTKAERMDK